MARLYGNENVPGPCVAELRKLGHDVLTSFEAGQANQRIGDDAVLAFAHVEGRVVLTNNRKDFRQLHTAGQPHEGIVEFTNDADFVSLARRIDAAVQDPLAKGRFYASVTKPGYAFR